MSTLDVMAARSDVNGFSQIIIYCNSFNINDNLHARLIEKYSIDHRLRLTIYNFKSIKWLKFVQLYPRTTNTWWHTGILSHESRQRSSKACLKTALASSTVGLRAIGYSSIWTSRKWCGVCRREEQLLSISYHSPLVTRRSLHQTPFVTLSTISSRPFSCRSGW